MATAKDRRIARRIEEILRLRNSSLANELVGVDCVRTLPAEIRERIIEELGEEFSKKGLSPDNEPNAYGMEIEDLTDACAPWHDEP